MSENKFDDDKPSSVPHPPLSRSESTDIKEKGEKTKQSGVTNGIRDATMENGIDLPANSIEK